ncbi:MAG TPA: hypothetical protein VMJ10_08770 [Kofleriaceae bacterium]|nr:hypothetical protein [Kofleriaceae bacterium]
MTDNDPLAPRRLAEYDVPGAPSGFASRVMAAIDDAPPLRSPRRRWPLIAGAVAAVAAIAIIAKLGLGSDEHASGARTIADRRETVMLARRGVAVAEPGTALNWTIAGDGAAEVEQSSGRAFYRVEHGGPFEVRTPLGVVQVTGTCFSVEVTAMKNPINRDMVKGASFGAVVATAVLVTVYEGSITLANPSGQLQVAPGDTAIVRPGEPPRRESAAIASSRELADARARIVTLEHELAAARGADKGADIQNHDPGRYYAPSPETLREMADKCWIAFDRPPFTADGAPELVDAKLAIAVGVSDAERAAINAAYKTTQDRELEALRRLYMELTGADADTTAMLSVDALEAEITAKSSDDDEIAARRAIARSRAGLEPEPTGAELVRRSAIERMLRLEIALGSEAEAAAASVVGADRAHELRAHDGAAGWQNSVSDYGGCDESYRR